MTCPTLRSFRLWFSFSMVLVILLTATNFCLALEDKQKPENKQKPAVQKAPVTKKKAACEKQKPTVDKKKPCDKKDPFAWRKLFDGKTLKGWKVPNFGGQGDVTVEDGTIVMKMGEPMTGIAYTDKVPKTNYELELEALRTDGSDFFAATTFPVGKDPCTLVVGGWGGTVVGLSCVDWYDASDNMTTQFMEFKDNKWYKIRIQVSDTKIVCWIDDEKLVTQPRKDHKFSIRFEVELCQPLGVCSWITGSKVRNLRIRTLKPEEIAAAAKPDKE